MQHDVLRRVIGCPFALAVVALLIGHAAVPSRADTALDARIRSTLKSMESGARKDVCNISPEDGRLLCELTKKNKAQHVLVIAGPAGYSALWFCLGLNETGGKLTYLQEQPEPFAESRKTFAAAGVEDMVTAIRGNPHDTWSSVPRPIDIVFLDADKGGDQDYLHKILPRIRPGGLLIAHDTRSDPELVKNYLRDIKLIPKLENEHLDAGGAGMMVSRVRAKARTVGGKTPEELADYTPPGPEIRTVTEKPANAVLGYINRVPPETKEHRAWRHKRVAERRGNTPIICHRGDDSAAPENTLEAFMAAIDNGADGSEIDIRRSKDGVLYFMHDGDIDRVAHGKGDGGDMTYYELLQVNLKKKGRANEQTRIPTLCSFLELARRHAMLIHLDVKEGGIEKDLADLLDAFDMWDHLVEVNAGNAITIRHAGPVELLAYKGGWGEGDYSAEQIRQLIARSGEMIFCEYPGKAAKILKRDTDKETPIPADLRTWWTPEGPVRVAGDR